MSAGSKKQKVGNRYYFGAALVPLRQHDHLLAVEMANKLAWSGRARNDRITINQPSLFGGDEREGGFVGDIDVQDGNNAQGINDYLAGAKSTFTGAMRGCVSLVFRRPYFGANTARLPAIRTLHSNIRGWSGNWQRSLAVINPDAKIDGAAVFFTIDRSRQVDVRSFQRKLETCAAFVRSMKGGTNSIFINVPKHPNDGTVAAISLQRHNVSTDSEYDEIADIVLSIEKTFFSLNGDPLNISAAAGFFATAAGTGSSSFLQPILNSSGGGEGSTAKRNVIIPMISLPYSVAGFNTQLAALQAQSYAVEVVCIGGEGISGQDGRDTCFLLDGQVDIDQATDIPFAAADPDDPELSTDVQRLQHIQAPFRLWADLNPAHIIRTLWTDPMRGGTVAESEIGDSFAIEAQRYFDEGMGLSCKFRGLDQIDADRLEVERHVDAMSYRSTATGKIEIVSIRDNYNVNDLIVLDSGIVQDWSQLSRPRKAEIPNQLTVEYTRRDGKKGSVTRTNVAGVRRQGRIIKAQTAQYPWATTEALATRLCLRDLRAVSSDLLVGDVPITYLPPGIEPGSVVILNEPTLGINNVVVRVLEVEIGKYDDSSVRLSVSEDKFAAGQQIPEVPLPSNSNIKPALDVSPSIAAEASYFQLVLAAGQSQIDDELDIEPDLGRLFVTGAPANDDQIDARIATTPTGGTVFEDRGLVDFEPFGVLVEPLDALPTSTTFLVVSNASLESIFEGDLCVIDDEIIRIDNLEDQGNGTTLVTVGRGCLDSVPAAHAAGAALVVVSVADPLRENYIAGQSLDVKLLSRTGTDQQMLDAAPTVTVPFASRAFRPYPVGRFQVDSAYTVPGGSASVTATWVHRDRTIQTTPSVDDHTAASIGPESGVFYTPFVKYYGEWADVFAAADWFGRTDFFADHSEPSRTYLIEGVLSPSDALTYTFDLSVRDFFDYADVFAQADWFELCPKDSDVQIAVGVRTSRGSPQYDNRQEPDLKFAPLAPPVLVAAEE